MYSKVMETEKSEELSKVKGTHAQSASPENNLRVKKADPLEVIWRVRKGPESLTNDDMIILQNSIGNRATMKLISEVKKAKDVNVIKGLGKVLKALVKTCLLNSQPLQIGYVIR